MGTFTSTLVAGLTVGAGIAGYMDAPWITVAALTLITLVATTMHSFAIKPIGPISDKSVVAKLASDFVIVCLLFAAVFVGGRLIAMLG
jgi:hypothetical protein